MIMRLDLSIFKYSALFLLLVTAKPLHLESVTLLVHSTQAFESDLSLTLRGLWSEAQGPPLLTHSRLSASLPGVRKSSPVAPTPHFSWESFTYKPIFTFAKVFFI